MTPTEIVSVTLYDSSAALELTAVQNALQPPPADCHRMAASGSSTMTLSQNVAAPTRSDVVPPWPPAARRRRRPDRESARSRSGHPVACL